MPIGSIDPRKFREALGHYASGVTIISGLVDGDPVGFTCQSFYSVSLDPPLVSFSVQRTSNSWPKLRAASNFAINVLSSDQIEVSNAFARSTGNRWENVRWRTSPHKCPVIDDALLWLDCGHHVEHEAGDHWVVICRVNSISEVHALGDRSPLIYYKGRYRQLTAL